jgi:ABC-type phosphate transport system substrate-binding protein
VSIVANRDVPVDGLTLAQLRRIFLADEQYWRPGGRRIRLLVRRPEANERQVVLRRIYGMTEEQFNRYWAGKRYGANAGSNPREVVSASMARWMAASTAGAITFVPMGQEGTGVKRLRIDGKLPGEPGYPLQ